MIDLISTSKMALRTLRANKMRSALTSLGIIIGVCAVIIMLAIGMGAKAKLQKQIANLGTNVMIIHAGSMKSHGVRMGRGARPSLKLKDINFLKENCPYIKKAAARSRNSAQVVYGSENWQTEILGTTPDYIDIQNWSILAGVNISDIHIKRASKVCLLGQTVLKNLFGDMNPLGKLIRIKGQPFKVIGILSEKGEDMRGMDMDDKIIIPVTTSQKKVFGSEFADMLESIMIQVHENKDFSKAQTKVEETMRLAHKISDPSKDDFEVRNLAQFLDTMKQTTNIMTILLSSIAGVSLLVGGIGIMNIMLVSVTERTREIGIRLAIGAKIIDIRIQFLVEAIILAFIGGIIGVFVGIGGSFLLGALTGWTIKVSIMSIALALGFSSVIGIFFGYYPAYKASLLNPIDALRQE